MPEQLTPIEMVFANAYGHGASPTRGNVVDSMLRAVPGLSRSAASNRGNRLLRKPTVRIAVQERALAQLADALGSAAVLRTRWIARTLIAVLPGPTAGVHEALAAADAIAALDREAAAIERHMETGRPEDLGLYLARLEQVPKGAVFADLCPGWSTEFSRRHGIALGPLK